MPNHPRFLQFSSALIGAAILSMLVAPTRMGRGGRDMLEMLGVGLLLGTLYAQVTLATAWLSFGTGRLPQRVIITTVWLTLLPFAATLNSQLHHYPDQLEFLIILSLSVLGQFILVLLSLGAVRMFLGWRLVGAGTEEPSSGEVVWQFRLSDLMKFTAVIAVLFGAGRIFVVHVAPNVRMLVGREWLAFAFLTVSAFVITLPLLFAAFTPGKATVPTCAIILMLIAAATALESPLWSTLERTPNMGPSQWHFIWINVATSGWILLFSTVTRLSGFRLRVDRRRTS